VTGRKWELFLYPLTVNEMIAYHGLLDEDRHLGTRLVFGWYPEAVARPELAQQLLTELANDTLYKDIFALKEVRRAEPFERLVQALAYIVFRVNSDSRNLRNELKASSKIYFTDSPGGLQGYGIKWSPAARVTFPASFRNAYPEAMTTAINRDNVLRVLAEYTSASGSGTHPIRRL